MKVDLNRVVLLTLVGFQIVLILCMMAMEKRISLIESQHHEPKDIKK
jgi:hypothetical protein